MWPAYNSDMKLRVLRVVSVSSIAVLALASCSGSSEPAAAPPESASPSVAAASAESSAAASSDGAAMSDGEAEGNAGFESTGSVIADRNREKYVALGMTDEDLVGVQWSGDVTTADGKFVEYGDGLRIEFVDVKLGDAAEADELDERDKSKSLVTVRLKVSNSGDSAVPIDSSWLPFNVYEGANLEVADQFVGYGEPELTSPDSANAVGAGSSFEVWASFQVDPGAKLEVETNPDFFGESHTPFVFTGVVAP